MLGEVGFTLLVPQLIVSSLLYAMPVPLPFRVTFIDCVGFKLNVAVTVLSSVGVTRQSLPKIESHPDQSAKLELGSAIYLKVLVVCSLGVNEREHRLSYMEPLPHAKFDVFSA